ncbi:MAG: GTPase, partial [Pseudomonadota bacterium]
GEFTRRALENSNLDLAQVEGLSDLIEAETEAQRAQANRIFSGELGQKAQHWRERLIRAAALLEATIDFADEDVPEDVTPEVLSLIENVKSELGKEIAGASAAERIRSGFEVAIIGAPNVGKSTLINKLARREAAITSQYAGTTRDVIEVRMDLAGLPVTVLDTAGLRDTDDPVEAIGIDRATERAKQADLRVALCLPEEKPPLTLNEDDILLVAKSDLYGSPENGISGTTGFGVSELIEGISLTLSKRASNAGLAITARHRDAMMRGEENLRKALSTIENDQSTIELAAEEIRTSIRALDSLVGRIDVENLLDEIFLRFCIGK